MATVSKWTPFGVALDVTATAATVTRVSATQYTVKINASWETYYSGAKTVYGMSATSGGASVTLNKFGTNSSGSSGTLTGTYSISGNGAATKTVTVTFNNYEENWQGTVIDSATKTVSFSVTVPAWTSYTVQYNANGGTGAPSAQTKWKDQILKLSTTTPTRAGYSFQGWVTSASGGASYAAGANYTTNASVTLYAVWKANTYTVTFNANGGTGAPSNQTKTHGVALTLASAKPSRTNYTFKGWGTSASSTTASYQAGGSYTANASATLYAVWELAYVKPRITNLLVERCDSDGTPNANGLNALVKFQWGSDKDISSITIRWKPSTSQSYPINNSTTIGASGKSGSVSSVVGADALNAETAYTIRVVAMDAGGESEKTVTLNTSQPVLHCRAGGNGIAFGGMATEADAADFYYKTNHRKTADFKQGTIHRATAAFKNGVAIHGTKLDGESTLEAFNPRTADGNVRVGYGNYEERFGNTNIYGHDINHYVSNIATPGIYRPYRRQGDSITLSVRTAGYVTNSGKDVSFFVSLSEPIVGSPTITVDSLNGFTLRQGAKYTHGSSANGYAKPTSYSAVYSMMAGVFITATFSDTTNVTNNDSIGIYWNGIITFS